MTITEISDIELTSLHLYKATSSLNNGEEKYLDLFIHVSGCAVRFLGRILTKPGVYVNPLGNKSMTNFCIPTMSGSASSLIGCS